MSVSAGFASLNKDHLSNLTQRQKPLATNYEEKMQSEFKIDNLEFMAMSFKIAAPFLPGDFLG